MGLGTNIAIGLGSAFIVRLASNAAFQATLPQVDPTLPMAGPVLGAVALPGIGGGVAMAYKYPKVASALFGAAAGMGISTAEYMAYAREAQSPASLPAGQAYTWIAVHKDGSLDTVAIGTYDLAQLPMQDAAIVTKYGPDSDITMIVRKDAAGHQAVLADKTVLMSGKQSAMQSGETIRRLMRR